MSCEAIRTQIILRSFACSWMFKIELLLNNCLSAKSCHDFPVLFNDKPLCASVVTVTCLLQCLSLACVDTNLVANNRRAFVRHLTPT